MDEPIDNLYFDWLCAKVIEPGPNYLELFRILHSHIFPDVNRLDENRVADAKELRETFLEEWSLVAPPGWLTDNCSVFEILIAFSERAAFQIEMSTQEWFWQFITNLRLDDYRRVTASDKYVIYDILDSFVLRKYRPNGDGGLFPLRRPQRDQREVEIWYQFCDYVDDNGLLYGLI